MQMWQKGDVDMSTALQDGAAANPGNPKEAHATSEGYCPQGSRHWWAASVWARVACVVCEKACSYC